MLVKVNGKDQVVNATDVSLIELLKNNNVVKPELVSVQLNGVFVKREAYESIFVKENDEIDFLFFMGGGSSFNSKN